MNNLTIKSTLLTDVFNIIGVKRFDRKKESLNKIKHRMKGYYNGNNKKNSLASGIQGTGFGTSNSTLNNESAFH
jgi:hypothetical protein